MPLLRSLSDNAESCCAAGDREVPASPRACVGEAAGEDGGLSMSFVCRDSGDGAASRFTASEDPLTGTATFSEADEVPTALLAGEAGLPLLETTVGEGSPPAAVR